MNGRRDSRIARSLPRLHSRRGFLGAVPLLDELLRAVFAVARGGAVVDPLVAEAVVIARMRADGSPFEH